MSTAQRDPFSLRKIAARTADLIWRRRRVRNAYRATFLGNDGKPHPQAQIVFADLARAARHGNSIMVVGGNGQVDPLASMVAEGQRALLERIRLYCAIDDADLYHYERAERAMTPPENSNG